ncbi:proteasome assembly protein [Malassezia pachydermatis]
MQWIESAGFSEILILSSMDAAMRVDHEFATPFVYARPMQATEGPVASAITSQYPPFQPSLQGSNVVSMPGSGLARVYLEHAPPNTTALFLFCAEGDNRSDAHAMAKRVTALLHKETGM